MRIHIFGRQMKPWERLLRSLDGEKASDQLRLVTSLGNLVKKCPIRTLKVKAHLGQGVYTVVVAWLGVGTMLKTAWIRTISISLRNGELKFGLKRMYGIFDLYLAISRMVLGTKCIIDHPQHFYINQFK